MKEYFRFDGDWSWASGWARTRFHPAIQIKVLPRIALAAVCVLVSSPAAMANMMLANPPASGGGYEIATEAGNTFGTAVEFTPLESVAVASVTLWIAGYTGLDGSSLVLSIDSDSSSYGAPFSGPAATITTGSAAPNDGSDAAFTFDLTGQLQANTPYWLFLYLQVPGGGVGPDYGRFNCSWDSGGSPSGDMILNGSEAFINGFDPSSVQSDAPAFAINAVPELTSTASLLAVAAGGCLMARRRLRRD